MAHTLSTPVAQARTPRRPALWTVKAHQHLTGDQRKLGERAKLVHKTTVTAFTRDAVAKTRELLGTQGYYIHKVSFGPNSTIIVDVSPISPMQIRSRTPAPRKPKTRIVNKRISASSEET